MLLTIPQAVEARACVDLCVVYVYKTQIRFHLCNAYVLWVYVSVFECVRVYREDMLTRTFTVFVVVVVYLYFTYLLTRTAVGFTKKRSFFIRISTNARNHKRRVVFAYSCVCTYTRVRDFCAFVLQHTFFFVACVVYPGANVRVFVRVRINAYAQRLNSIYSKARLGLPVCCVAAV